jgi:hypothetical protein
VTTAFGSRTATEWSELSHARFHTNTGALVLSRRARAGSIVFYPRSLERAAALVGEIDARTSLQLSAIPDLQAAIRIAA